jgi:ketosteroid isomerase-like protein
MKSSRALLLAAMAIVSVATFAQSKKSSKNSSTDPTALNAKANELMRAGKVSEALPLFEKAAELGMAEAKGRADMAKAKLKFPSPSDKDKEEIKNCISGMSAAQLKGDVDAMMKFYSDHAIELFPSQIVNAGFGNIRTRMLENLSFGSFAKVDRGVERIEGAGGIAVAWGQSEISFKPTNAEPSNNQRDEMFLFRKQTNGEWKILAHHWIPRNNNAKTSNDSLALRQVLDKWSYFIKPGEILEQKHVDNIEAIYSAQAVDLLPNERALIGMANLRIRWQGFSGIKWAQFTDLPFDVNYFSQIGTGSSAARAVAWGIGDHSNYSPGSDNLAQYLFPFAMFLTREQDGQWRVLVYHFYTE